MKIASVKLINVLGIGEYEFAPGRGFTELCGPNGIGKTSIVSAFQSLGAKGHDATLLTAGAEKGEMVFVLDDGSKIEKTITPTKTDVVARNAAGKKIERPVDFLRSIIDVKCINPIAFLHADADKRVKILLESMPIEIDLPRLKEMSGLEKIEYPGMHGLFIIDATHSIVFNARRDVNRDIKQKESTIKQLTDVLPPEVDGVSSDEEVLRADIAKNEKERNDECTRCDQKLAGIKAEAATKKTNINEQVQEKISALERQIADLKVQKQADVAAVDAETAEFEKKAMARKQWASDRCVAANEPLNAQLTLIVGNRESAARREQALKTIDTMQEELQVLRETKEQHEKSLQDIDAYKTEILEALPIPGIKIKGDQIFRGEVPFDRLNTQQKVEISVSVAKLTAGKLALVCIDGLEVLDKAHYEAFKEAQLSDPDLQFIVSRVTDDPEFTLRTT